MKMKKMMIMTAATAALLSVPAAAQGLYLGVGGGYGFPAGRQTLGSDQKTVFQNGEQKTDHTARSISLGNGINAGLYAGYMFNKNIGAELGFSYLMGMKSAFLYETSNPTAKTSTKSEDSYTASMLRIIPALRFSVGEEKLRPYMKMGIIIGVAGMVKSEDHSESVNSATTTISDRTREYSGGMSLGFHGGVGVNYFVTDNIGIFLEVAANVQSYAPSKSIMTVNTANGKDLLPDMDRNQKETEYLDNYTYDSSVNTNKDAPDQSLKFQFPFSSISINLGVHYTFGGKE